MIGVDRYVGGGKSTAPFPPVGTTGKFSKGVMGSTPTEDGFHYGSVRKHVAMIGGPCGTKGARE